MDIKDDKTYVVISKEGGIVYKRLRLMNDQNGLLMMSDNNE
ncbi:MAG: S24/S26 family peptidase [Saprospiraceae bacterium]